jgi:hypothetical protein
MPFERAVSFGLAFFALARAASRFPSWIAVAQKTCCILYATKSRKQYADPKLHGLAWDAELAQAKQQINEAKSFTMASGGAMLDTLNDLSRLRNASSCFNTSRTREPVE